MAPRARWSPQASTILMILVVTVGHAATTYAQPTRPDVGFLLRPPDSPVFAPGSSEIYLHRPPAERMSRPREPVEVTDPHAAPWHALGGIYRGFPYGRVLVCTGALVAPDRVLAAGQCVVAAPPAVVSTSGPPPGPWPLLPAGDIAFAAVTPSGQTPTAIRVASYATAPAPSVIHAHDVGNWVILTLERPVDGPGLPLLDSLPDPGTPLAAVGFHYQPPRNLVADTACRLLGVDRTDPTRPRLIHDCVAPFNLQGAVLLARKPDGDWAIAGLTRYPMDVAGDHWEQPAAPFIRSDLPP